MVVRCLNTDLHLGPQISLFLDLLKCLCSDLIQDQFVGEDRAGCSSVSGPNGATVRSGRSELWRILRGAPLSLGQQVFALIHFLFPVVRGNFANRQTIAHTKSVSDVGR